MPGPPSVPAAASIGALGVVTRNRPQAALRCLAGFAAHLRAHGRRPRLVAVDSSDPPQGELLRRALPGLDGGETVWFGNQHKRRFAERLSQASGVDLELVRFALFDTEGLGHDIGANRNCLLLLLAGGPFLSVDDDVECDLRRRPGSAPALVVARTERTPEVTLHRDFSAARAALVPAPGCVLDLHERVLGRTVAECLAEVPAAERAVAPRDRDLPATLVAAGARVVATFGGYFGDCGARYPAFYLWSERSLREQLLPHDDQAQRALVASRQMVRLASAVTITTGRFGMFPQVALDAGHTLPPFFPVLRGEDLAFSGLLRGCFPSRLFAHLPQALAHRPCEARTGDADRLWDPTPAAGASGLLGQLLEGAIAATGPAPDLVAVGRWLRALSDRSPAEFSEVLRRGAAAGLARSVAWLENVLARNDGSPPFWADGLRRYCAYHREVMASPGLGIPLELLGRDDAPALLQRLVRGYGLLLEAWPALFAAARAGEYLDSIEPGL